MEGLDQNKLLQNAVWFMVMELQGLKDFYKPDCACIISKFKSIVSFDRCVLKMLGKCHLSEYLYNLSIDINHFVVSQWYNLTIFTFLRNIWEGIRKNPVKILPEDFDHPLN